MIDFQFETKCYSCTACKAVCPTKAINFDDKLFPHVDLNKCINCGKCERVCIKLNEQQYSKTYIGNFVNAYAAKNTDIDIRRKSSSGGIFYLLAQSVIENGGYVCGCIYDTDYMPKHILTGKMVDVEKMLGSKYVKSDLQDCIVQMRELLEKGTTVLFSGVPCEVAAVKTVLRRYSNLLTVAVACHGSMTRSIWKDYLEYEKMSGNLASVTMRDKSHGWLNYGLKFTFADGTSHVTYRYEDGYFLKCFTEGLFERNVCLQCNYKGNRIMSDILLADGWGIDQLIPGFVDNLGVSSIICLTELGNKLFELLPENKIIKEKISIDYIIDHNKRIVEPAPKNQDSDKLLKLIDENPLEIYEYCKDYIKKQNGVLHRLKRLFVKRNANNQNMKT